MTSALFLSLWTSSFITFRWCWRVSFTKFALLKGTYSEADSILERVYNINSGHWDVKERTLNLQLVRDFDNYYYRQNLPKNYFELRICTFIHCSTKQCSGITTLSSRPTLHPLFCTFAHIYYYSTTHCSPTAGDSSMTVMPFSAARSRNSSAYG